MKIKIVLLITAAAALTAISGCEESETLSKVKLTQQQPELKEAQAAANKFHNSSVSSTPVESAIELSKKYSKLCDDYEAEMQKNKELLVVNESREKRLAEYKSELDKATKELKEANQLLVDMRIELTNWKMDVLGFREEMRNADIAQLQALYKILKILGADVGEETVE